MSAGPARAMMPPLSGRVPDELVQVLHDHLYRAAPRPFGLLTQSLSGSWNIPVMLVSFADDSIRYSASDFQRLLFDTTQAIPTGSVAEYWKWVSRGRVRLTGRVVASVTLPQTEAFYAAETYGLTAVLTPRNEAGYVRDALRLGQASVNWTEFDKDLDGYVDMVWLVHSGVGGESGDRNRLWTFTSQLSGGWNQSAAYITSTYVPGTNNRPMLIDRFTVLPEMSLFHPGALSEVGPFCHEFGHTLGLPDLYDFNDPRNVGPGNWSLMSSGAYGGDDRSPETPVHIGGWSVQFFGWDRTVHPARDTTITLAPLESSTDLIDVWPQGENSPEHFLIENRRRVDYDRNLPGEGFLLYHVNGPAVPVVVEGDGDYDLQLGRNRGDASDPLPGALGITRLDDFTVPALRSFDGSLTNSALEDIASVGDSSRVRLRVRPLGWQPAEDWTGAGFNPVTSRTPARAAGHDDSGIQYVVTSEYLSGRPQVVLRTSTGWDQPMVLSHSTGSALNPTLAILPGGDLAVAWSDSRRGRSEVYYRARILGRWTLERPIVSRSGNCRTPALGADGRGGLYLAFQYQTADTVQLMFERMNYASAVGQPVVVAGAPVIPENPTVCVGPSGNGYLLWQDRRQGGYIWFASLAPDPVMPTVQPVSVYSQVTGTYAAVIDDDGALYVLWNQSDALGNELVQQVRRGPLLEEIVLETLPYPFETLALEVDAQHSIHVAFALAGPQGLTVRYRRRWTDNHWDVTSTDLSFPTGEQGGEPIVLPHVDGNVEIVYTGVSTQHTRFMLRRRVLTPPQPLHSRTPVASPAAAAPLWLAPNPAVAGSDLELMSGAPPANRGDAMLDVFDTGGRRVASVPVTASGADWTARVPAAMTRAWPSGVYFARMRGANRAARVVLVR